MKNPNKLYTGKVGAKPRAKRIRASRAAGKKGYFCIDGPMAGETLFLQADGASVVMCYMGATGRYISGKWEQS